MRRLNHAHTAPSAFPTSQACQVGELHRIGHGWLVQLAEFREEPLKLRWINETFPSVVFAKQRHGRSTRELPRAHREREHAAERRQLAVHGTGLLARREPSRRVPGDQSAVMSSALSKPNAARNVSTWRSASRSERLPFTR